MFTGCCRGEWQQWVKSLPIIVTGHVYRVLQGWMTVINEVTTNMTVAMFTGCCRGEWLISGCHYQYTCGHAYSVLRRWTTAIIKLLLVWPWPCLQDFLVVLGRPLALAHVENTQWTSSHKTPLTNNLSVSPALQSLPPPLLAHLPLYLPAPGSWFPTPSFFYIYIFFAGGHFFVDS